MTLTPLIVMEPVLVCLILFVLMPWVIFKGLRSLKETKYKAMYEAGTPAREASGGQALRQSELRQLIDEAVLDATIPLINRIDELERDMLVGSRIAPEAIAEAFGEPDEMEASVDRDAVTVS